MSLGIERVDVKDLEAYWHELMPRASVVRDRARRTAYFQDRFSWDGGNRHPFWAIADGRRIGFMMSRVSHDLEVAHVHDFYVVPQERRRGYGTAMVKWLFSHLERLGVVQIDLNVRVDNPDALEFWKAQGFEVALYRLRQYRNPKDGWGEAST